jgi:hypothetical protein
LARSTSLTGTVTTSSLISTLLMLASDDALCWLGASL